MKSKQSDVDSIDDAASARIKICDCQQQIYDSSLEAKKERIVQYLLVTGKTETNFR